MKKINSSFKAVQLAKDILAKREKEGITYAVAEQQTGVYKSILHRAESGLPISLESLPKICNWLGKPVQNYF